MDIPSSDSEQKLLCNSSQSLMTCLTKPISILGFLDFLLDLQLACRQPQRQGESEVMEEEENKEGSDLKVSVANDMTQAFRWTSGKESSWEVRCGCVVLR